jgi:hypothetical protein
MGDDTGLKSSFELAMERLRKKDEDAGIERQPVTDAQKAAIAEIRNFYEGGSPRLSPAPGRLSPLIRLR